MSAPKVEYVRDGRIGRNSVCRSPLRAAIAR